MDTRSVETTIGVGQNMQMCHSLRCKQIDRSTGTQWKSIQWRRGPFLRESLILVAAAHARVTEGCAQATNIWSRATEKEKRSPVQAPSFRLVRKPETKPANALKRNGTKPRRFRLSHGSCFASVVSLPVFYGPTFLSIERRGKASIWL